MKDDEWHSGPPPSVGWWPASWDKTPSIVRWWDGYKWGWPQTPNSDIESVEREAERHDFMQEQIQWKHRPDNWPERSKT